MLTLFSWSAALLKVVMDSGTFCWLSERFCAVTVISSNSLDGAAVPVSAASTCDDPIMDITPAQAKYFVDIFIVALPQKTNSIPRTHLPAENRAFSVRIACLV